AHAGGLGPRGCLGGDPAPCVSIEKHEGRSDDARGAALPRGAIPADPTPISANFPMIMSFQDVRCRWVSRCSPTFVWRMSTLNVGTAIRRTRSSVAADLRNREFAESIRLMW